MTRTNSVAGFVLAGGKSSRMGRDKALLELDGVPLVVRAVRLLEDVTPVVRVVGPPEQYSKLDLRVIPDRFPGQGPLGGIVTALDSSHTPWNLILPCDLPYVTQAWLGYLVSRALRSQADVVIPESTRGLEPLCAMYHKRALPVIEATFAKGIRKVTDALQAFPATALEKITPLDWKGFDSEGWLFKNMNSPADYEQARTRLEKQKMDNREQGTKNEEP